MSRAVVADAPGRVNLIGEHTDHQGGFVLPVPLPLRTRVELEARRDRIVRVRSDAAEPGAVREYELGAERRTRTWIDHVQAVTATLASRGVLPSGFDARIASTVPMGAGLASSAALAVALLRALRQAFAIELDDVELALLARSGERELVGADIGIMDQMVASVGREGEALFLDCRSLAVERVPLPASVEMLVVHSGVTHRHSEGGYNERRREAEEAARLLGVAQLRDVPPAELARADGLPDPLRRRARHVITENERVLEAVSALRAGDVAALGALLDASHRSLRDDFEVSTPEVDLLVDLLRGQAGAFGARITGGGFGGSVVALVERGRARAIGDAALGAYLQGTGRTATVLVPRSSPGAPPPSTPGRSSEGAPPPSTPGPH